MNTTDTEHKVTFSGGDGTISPADFVSYWDVFQSSFAVHLDREAKRHGLWKDYPASAQIEQVKIKTDRVLRSLELMSKDGMNTSQELEDSLRANAVEELLDIINYANFAVRQLSHG